MAARAEIGAVKENTAGRSIHFSSATVEWETPQWLFDELAWTYGGFTLDPCATTANAKCARFFTRSDDGLSQRWEGKVFVNPPYGRAIGRWVRKAFEESLEGTLVVCLRPARTDTRWWQEYAKRGQVWFLRGRAGFRANKECGARFPAPW